MKMTILGSLRICTLCSFVQFILLCSHPPLSDEAMPLSSSMCDLFLILWRYVEILQCIFIEFRLATLKALSHLTFSMVEDFLC